MTEALELVVRDAFARLRLHRLEANIQPGNRASIALVERGGFQREGVLAALFEGRRPLARPRALGDPRGHMACHTPRRAAVLTVLC